MSAVKLSWSKVESIVISKFRVYRSILGFVTNVSPFTGLAPGDTLILKIDDEANTTIIFPAINIDSVLAALNTITGCTAYKSADGLRVYFRHNTRSAPSKIQIVGGTGMTALGLTAKTIEELSDFQILTEIAVTDQAVQEYLYEDPNGVLEDWYKITALDVLNNESESTQPKQALSISGPICVIEGRLITGDGQPVVDAEITATLALPPEGTVTDASALIAPNDISTLSNLDGSFSLVLLRNQFYYLVIDAVKYSHYVSTPDAPSVKIKDLSIVDDNQFLTTSQYATDAGA